jgi:uncharacterized membrane protein
MEAHDSLTGILAVTDVTLRRKRRYWLLLGAVAVVACIVVAFAALKHWADWWRYVLSGAEGERVNYSWTSTFVAVGLLILAKICFSISGHIRVRLEVERRRRGDLTEKEVKEEIESRMRRAVDAKIAERVETIVSTLGSAGRFRSDTIDLIALGDRVVINSFSDVDWNSVFEAKLVPSSVTFTERRFLEPALDRPALEFTKELSSYSSPSRTDILGYIPGEWEATLDGLERMAVEKRKADQRESERLALASKNALLQQQRERFGLVKILDSGHHRERLPAKSQTDEEDA